MDAQRKILICGGGIAGPTCGYWLHRYGYSVVIAERAKSLRDGGQNVDIKGAGQLVMRKMGLADAILANNTLEQGQKYLDKTGKVVAAFPRGAIGGLTADFEVLRGDFAKILFDLTRDACEYRFGTYVTRLDEKDDCIAVAFNDGNVENFELVICAEGLNSSTRGMVLAEETQLLYLGAYMSFFNVPRLPEDDNWAHTVNGIGGTFITLRPGTATETTVLMTFLRDGSDVAADDPAARKRLLLEALKGRGTVADRIIAALGSVEDFYFGPMSQVHASAWSKGRFVMVGDAAYCPTPFTGEGTALGLVGAYVLAGEIKRNASHVAAFRAYETLVRPYAEASRRRINVRLIRLMHVKTWFGIAIARAIQRLFASRLVQRLLRPSEAKKERRVGEDFDLPNYG
ncbi:FAD-binding monooxygenase [Bradyrhizobium sp. Leo121]|nr:FAD-binding monooxygenase [Bradyrhizobium sp. Leo121]